MAGMYNIDERIEKAVTWAIDTALDPAHGYDQVNRLLPDVDCSSLVALALQNGGFNINPAQITTHNFIEWAINHGFTKIPYDKNFTFSRGDIVINPARHMVLMVNEYECVTASINEKGTITGGKTGDQTGKEVYVRYMYQPDYGWKYVLRFTFGGVFNNEQLFSYCPVIRLGMTGFAVRIAQAALAYKLNCIDLDIDGIYGEKSRQATIDFQKIHGLEDDGVIGKYTWLALFTKN